MVAVTDVDVTFNEHSVVLRTAGCTFGGLSIRLVSVGVGSRVDEHFVVLQVAGFMCCDHRSGDSGCDHQGGYHLIDHSVSPYRWLGV